MHRALPDFPIAIETRNEVITSLLEKLRTHYVFPEVAERIAETLQGRLAGGEYGAITSSAALCETLTTQMREIGRDQHLGVVCSAEPVSPRENAEGSPEWRAEYHEMAALRSYSFARVERLDGNVGYLDLRAFEAPEIAGDAAAAAMTLLARTSALIVDLRQNRGGWPEMVALLSTYLFGPELVHLNSLYWRATDTTQQFWTLPYVHGPRFGAEKPVFVLTSRDTFSGAEEFTYNLQTRKRATVVGERTRGGANPGDVYRLTPHFEAFIPTGRAINPITGTNWEGTGIRPDVAVPADEALKTAYREALQRVIEGIGEAPRGGMVVLLEEAREALAELDA